jgi:UDP-glucuronate decarboxylase
MNSEDDFTGPVNLGNPNEFTVLALAEQVLAEVNSSAGVEHLPLPSDDPTQRQPDITLAREKLSWQATTPLTEGLPPTIDYFRKVI